MLSPSASCGPVPTGRRIDADPVELACHHLPLPLFEAGIMPIRLCANDQKKVKAKSTVALLSGQGTLLAAIQRYVQGVQEVQPRKIADELESVTGEVTTDLGQGRWIFLGVLAPVSPLMRRFQEVTEKGLKYEMATYLFATRQSSVTVFHRVDRASSQSWGIVRTT